MIDPRVLARAYHALMSGFVRDGRAPHCTDGVVSVSHVPLRYVIAFTYHTMIRIKPFLARKGHAAAIVERMYDAWCKSVILQVALWSAAYARKDDW